MLGPLGIGFEGSQPRWEMGRVKKRIEAPKAVCLERNRGREAACRVPDFSIEHMAEAFEWPAGGKTWEAQDRTKRNCNNR